jgi:hypothetical protein
MNHCLLKGYQTFCYHGFNTGKKRFPKDEMYGLTSQIRRFAVSIPSNIAEGYGEKTTLELENKHLNPGPLGPFLPTSWEKILKVKYFVNYIKLFLSYSKQ